MPKILVKNAPIEVALRRFKRLCEKAGIPTRIRQIAAFEKPAEKRKREKAAERKRALKKRSKEREARNKDRGQL